LATPPAGLAALAASAACFIDDKAHKIAFDLKGLHNLSLSAALSEIIQINYKFSCVKLKILLNEL
jgi:hypothetical protein